MTTVGLDARMIRSASADDGVPSQSLHEQLATENACRVL